MILPANLWNGVKYPAISDNHLADIINIRHNYNEKTDKNLNSNTGELTP